MEEPFCVGDLVFAKMRGYPPWPARIEGLAPKNIQSVKYDVLFFGTYDRAACKEKDLFHYEKYKKQYGKPSRSKGFKEALVKIEEAAMILRESFEETENKEEFQGHSSSQGQTSKTIGTIIKEEFPSVKTVHVESIPSIEKHTSGTHMAVVKEELIDIDEIWKEQIKEELCNSEFFDILRIETVKDQLPDVDVKMHTDNSPDKSSQSFNLFQKSSIHTGGMGIQSSEKLFKCNECGNSFSTKRNIIAHMQIHSAKTQFKCKQCEKTFSQKGKLTVHIRVHSGEKPFKCKLCDKSFSRKDYLTVHMRIHSGEKPFKCKQCEKSFSQRQHLTCHLRTHSGEKPCKCKQCDKSFSQKSSLIAHMRVHSDERPFKCKQCDKSFSQKNIIPAHMRVHSGEKPFECKQCEKSFSQRPHLTCHMRTHSGEKPFKCKQCDKSFSQKHHVTAHMRTHLIGKSFNCK